MIDTERLSEATLPPWVRREHQARYRFAARHVAGRAVVDCACGAGLGTAQFVAAGARRVLGIDVSADAIRLARAASPAQFVLAAGTALPLPPRSVDAFVSLETVEHVADDGAFIDEIARVLSSDGIFICSTPNRTVKNPGLRAEERPINPFHVREYTEGEFRSLLARRFRTVEILGQNPCRRYVARLGTAARRFLPVRMLARMQQGSKFRYLLPPLRAGHEVQRARADRDYEFFVALCTGVTDA